ncbi:MAG: bifunctional diaminohydroxyphosphoribosylaminopyrimidine deaminase/5-amino-6-(5-phosphoribosylamino)uracil reductase RibD [Candidatus Hydrogenedens sp.]
MEDRVNKDLYYMRRALELAKKGKGRTSPNPMVGCVIVKNDKVIGEGYHQKAGSPHAEIVALNSVIEDTHDSTIYVTLEPCTHFGKTPPCISKVIEARPKRVVIAMQDPNPIVSGKGIDLLKSSGIEVLVGILEEEARKLNEIFIKYITQKIPFVIAKWAMTMDGKIATITGDSKYISAPDSLKIVHSLRNEVDAVLVGGKTVLEDNPLLTVRHVDGSHRNPIRIILDTRNGLSEDLNVFKDRTIAPTWIVTTYNRNYSFVDRIIKLKSTEKGYIPLTELMQELGKLEISSLLIEGGGTVFASAFQEKIVDKVYSFICPKIFGGENAISPVMGYGIAQKVDDAINLRISSIKKLDKDVLIESYVIKQKV